MLVLLATMACAGCAASNGDTTQGATTSGYSIADTGNRSAAGRSTTRAESQPKTQQVSSSTAPEIALTHDAAVRVQAAKELGPKAASSMPQVPGSAPLEPIDPGASHLVRSIADALAERRNAGDTITISLISVRNLSRSGAEEFNAFVKRLGDLLTRAGAEQRIKFVNDASAVADYLLLGTAYLVNSSGFDQWELYLSLTPTDRDWQVWDARNAVRVLRTARAGQPQVTYIGK